MTSTNNTAIQKHAAFHRLANRMSYIPDYHVIESKEFSDVIYAVHGNTIGITTLHNGTITMPFESWRRMIDEADEVFSFWKQGNNIVDLTETHKPNIGYRKRYELFEEI